MACFVLLSTFVLCLLATASPAPWTFNSDIPAQSSDINAFKTAQNTVSSGSGGSDVPTKSVTVNNTDYDESDEDDVEDSYGVNFDEYYSYMEKKVAKLIYKGGIFLDGLRRALQQYKDRLENCTRNYNTVNFTDPTQVLEFTKCQQATLDSERIRRVAQLAIWTTKEIQDQNYSPHHDKDDLEDKTLLLRLAWLLDRLAQMTGYEPKPEDFLVTDAPVTTTSNPMQPIKDIENLKVPDEMKMNMMNCLNRTNSSQPAYERCPQESPMIPTFRRLFNVTEGPMSTTLATSTVPTDSSAAPSIGQTKNPRIQKDIMDDDLMTSSSSILLSKITKDRDESPKDANNSQIKDRQLKMIRRTRDVSSNGRQPISRIPADPYRDLSYYSKSKDGTNVNANPVEAAQVRLYLEQAFQNPNIEITRRYGSNYNPLIPNVVLAGVLKSILDA